MSHAESARDRFIRRTGKDVFHIYEERGFVKIVVHEGGYGDDSKRSVQSLDPESAANVAERIEDDAPQMSEEILDKVEEAKMTRYRMAKAAETLDIATE